MRSGVLAPKKQNSADPTLWVRRQKKGTGKKHAEKPARQKPRQKMSLEIGRTGGAESVMPTITPDDVRGLQNTWEGSLDVMGPPNTWEGSVECRAHSPPGKFRNRSSSPLDGVTALDEDERGSEKRPRRMTLRTSTTSSGTDGGRSASASSSRQGEGMVAAVPSSPASSVTGSSAMQSPSSKTQDSQAAKLARQKVLNALQKSTEMDVLKAEGEDPHFKLEEKVENLFMRSGPSSIWSAPDKHGEVVSVSAFPPKSHVQIGLTAIRLCWLSCFSASLSTSTFLYLLREADSTLTTR